MRAGILVAVIALAGCGGPPDQAQPALTAGGEALVAIDHVTATEYTRAAAEALDASATAAEYERAMQPWNTVETSLRVAHEALLTAQAGLDAWREGADDGARWTAAIPCLVRALDGVGASLSEAGVQTPAPLDYALRLARSFGGRCDVGGE